MGAPKRVKPPIEKAEYQIDKQIEAIKASTLAEGQQAQLVDYFTGLKRACQSVEQVVDPANPPSPESVYGKLIALGRSQRTLGTILSGGMQTAPTGEAPPAGETPPEPAAPQVPAPQEPADVGI
jgi:hypothetical protein